MDDWGVPLNYRHMEGFGVHTFVLVNAAGKETLVKFHWKPSCGGWVAGWRCWGSTCVVRQLVALGSRAAARLSLARLLCCLSFHPAAPLPVHLALPCSSCHSFLIPPALRCRRQVPARG